MGLDRLDLVSLFGSELVSHVFLQDGETLDLVHVDGLGALGLEEDGLLLFGQLDSFGDGWGNLGKEGQLLPGNICVAKGVGFELVVFILGFSVVY